MLNPDRYFPMDSKARGLARELYHSVKDLPILSPHGHTDPFWYSENKNFPNPTELLVTPDHYLLRMLYSQGIPLEKLGKKSGADPKDVWQIFADNFHLFRGTPTAMWIKYAFEQIFEIPLEFGSKTAMDFYARIQKQLETDAFKPVQLLSKFKIELISTTDSPVDDLALHKKINSGPLKNKVIPCFRPDPVLDPDHEDFHHNLNTLSSLTKENCEDFAGYLRALQQKRIEMKSLGATATDHGHPTALTIDISQEDAKKLFQKALSKKITAEEAEVFRGHMLMEMARMSLEDGLVMQLHPGSYRNHNEKLFKTFGRDVGADIPKQMDYVSALRPLLNKFGNESQFSFIVFTLDESTYSRELAPLAGHYPALKLGPSWWFHDSPEGMLRFREQTTETAGFYNTVGFNDDTRAFFSIPARHDLARRIDSRFLSQWVCEHRISEVEAFDVLKDLTYGLVKKAYKLK